MHPQTPSARGNAERLAIIVAVIFQIVLTFLSSFGFGEPIGSRSDANRTLITPAGQAFAIWGPLYASSVLFAIYQALPSQKDNARLGRIGWFAAAAFAGNGLWALYTQSNGLAIFSPFIIFIMLACQLDQLRPLPPQPA